MSAIRTRDSSDDEARMYDELAAALARRTQANQRLIVRRGRWLMACTVLLIVQVAMWGIELWV